MNLHDLSPGTAPLLVSMSHCGTRIPPRLAADMTPDALHGSALLFDVHSIVSVSPRIFEGRLTDINLGTADGASCVPALGAWMLAWQPR